MKSQCLMVATLVLTGWSGALSVRGDEVWAWRSTYGSSATLPPVLRKLDPGVWRPTPPAL